MQALLRALSLVGRAIRRAVRELHWALPGGPGRARPFEELEDIEQRRRREREVWRQGTDK